MVELLKPCALGASERTVTIERDGWILSPRHLSEPGAQMGRAKANRAADPTFRDLYVECDKAFDWEPTTPGRAD